MSSGEKRVETEEKGGEKNVEQANEPLNDSPGGGRYNFRKRVKPGNVALTSRINVTPKRKNFSGLPRHLQELVLLKTNVSTRFELLQTNKQLLKWTREEGLFPRDLEKLSLHYGTALLTTRERHFHELKGKRRSLVKSTRTARILEVETSRYGDFELRTALPHLVKVFDARIYLTTFAKFRATFLDTAFKIRRALYFEFAFSQAFMHITAQDVETVLQFVDRHNDGIKFIDFENFPLKKVFDWLKTQRFRLASFVVADFEFTTFQEALNLVLKDGVPGVGNNPVLALRIFDSNTCMGRITRLISDKKPITVSQTTAIYQQFRGALQDAPESMQLWVMNEETLGFKQQFDKKKNLVYLINQEGDDLCLLIKFEPIF